jgi:hypothetical protein
MSITLHELLDQLYGIKTTQDINKTSDVVNIAPTRILSNNPNRVSFLIVNLSGNAIYIAPDNNVSTTRGIYLAANGGTAGFQWDRDFDLVSMEWFGTSTVDARDVFILENISI